MSRELWDEFPKFSEKVLTMRKQLHSKINDRDSKGTTEGFSKCTAKEISEVSAKVNQKGIAEKNINKITKENLGEVSKNLTKKEGRIVKQICEKVLME